jgi:predicted DNA-binding transcriptional regulator YafY
MKMWFLGGGKYLAAKLDPYASYGTKVVSLFAKLLFSQQSHSLTDLARMLRCSKQTVLRLIADIQRAYGVQIEESISDRRKYYKLIKKVDKTHGVPLTSSEVVTLHMCKSFAEHLLGPGMIKDMTRAVEKSCAGSPCQNIDHFSALQFGRIDYAPHQESLVKTVQAMQEKRICKITYQAGYKDRPETLFIKPLRLFTFKETMYLFTQLARTPGKTIKFDPLLALHRIQHVAITDRYFEYPKNFDFTKIIQCNAGLINGRTFNAEVEFCDWAARYVSERIWGPDQKIVRLENGNVRLKLKVSAELEFISWILSFQNSAKLIKPQTLVHQMKRTIDAIRQKYNEI